MSDIETQDTEPLTPDAARILQLEREVKDLREFHFWQLLMEIASRNPERPAEFAVARTQELMRLVALQPKG